METPIVIITGASAGIGLSAARQLAEKGCTVYAASRRAGEGQNNDTSAGQVIPVRLDVNNEKDVESIFAKVYETHGRIDVVISNAGNGIAGSVEDTSDEEARYQFETNFFGSVKVLRAALPYFRKQGYGKLIATSSVAGIVPIPFQAFYSASKSALLLFMQALSMEVKPYGIQCCTVLPGDTKTDFTAARKYTVHSQNPESVYYQKMKTSVGKMEKDEQNGMSVEVVAGKIVKQVFRRTTKSIVIPGFQYQLICWLFNRLPVKFKLWAVGSLY